MKIIGITGTIGAGKGTIVEYLTNKKDFTHFSVRQYLIEIIEKRGMLVNRDSMVSVANELRAKYGADYIAIELYKQAKKSGKNCVIESLRTSGEIKTLRQKDNFYLIAINADASVRYKRVLKRKSQTDMINFETFVENEKREMKNEDPNKQNLSVCIKMADFTLNNNKTIEDLYKQIDNLFIV